MAFHRVVNCGFEAANETEVFSVHLRTDGLAAGWHYRHKRAQVCQLKPFGLPRNPCGVWWNQLRLEPRCCQIPETGHTTCFSRSLVPLPARLCMDLDGSALTMPMGDTLHQAQKRSFGKSFEVDDPWKNHLNKDKKGENKNERVTRCNKLVSSRRFCVELFWVRSPSRAVLFHLCHFSCPWLDKQVYLSPVREARSFLVSVAGLSLLTSLWFVVSSSQIFKQTQLVQRCYIVTHS